MADAASYNHYPDVLRCDRPVPRYVWEWQSVFTFYLLGCSWLILAFQLPPSAWPKAEMQAVWIVGVIGLWRYGWWLLNFARAFWYGARRYPVLRKAGDVTWEKGWGPSHIHFLMTTYREHAETTHQFLQALVTELRRDRLRATLWIGLGAVEDERTIREWMRAQSSLPLEIVLLRQSAPGKRMAIGMLLRALARRGVGPDDIAFLMDGDSLIGRHLLQKTLSLFAADPALGALTTNEEAVVQGPAWVRQWLTMRFAQRRMWMQSHALSGRVLTLTGRLSAFRASLIVEEHFIRTMEEDALSHWLWGTFRFLSGDDKSTWYCLLARRVKMLYVPDAMVYTVERIEGNGVRRMYENLLRWSGNMLRNGTRAILLGPRTVPLYIWWCLIDQRIAIWTVLLGLTTTLVISIFLNPAFLLLYLLWVTFTRTIIACGFYFFTDRLRPTFPLYLYLNQVTTAFLKLYLSFRLPMQRWANRSNTSVHADYAMGSRRLMATYLTMLYTTAMLLTALLITGVIHWPKWYQLPF